MPTHRHIVTVTESTTYTYAIDLEGDSVYHDAVEAKRLATERFDAGDRPGNTKITRTTRWSHATEKAN